MAPTRTPRRPPLGEVSTNTPGKAPIEKTPENITRPGPKRKTKEQRSTTWVDPGKTKMAYHANDNSAKEKYIMYHHTARVEHWDHTLQQNVMEQPYYREVYEQNKANTMCPFRQCVDGSMILTPQGSRWLKQIPANSGFFGVHGIRY